MRTLIIALALAFTLPAFAAGDCPEGTVKDDKGECVVVESE